MLFRLIIGLIVCVLSLPLASGCERERSDQGTSTGQKKPDSNLKKGESRDKSRSSETKPESRRPYGGTPFNGGGMP
jgi:hypothetical protein